MADSRQPTADSRSPIGDSRKPVLGLLGGMGSGKSSVAAEFAQHGGRIVSGDQLGHEALRQPDLRARIVAHFGTEILDDAGEINRRRLGAKVFADPAQRRALEAIVHPWIERQIEEAIGHASADPEVAFIVLDAAIMLEAGWNKVCDRLVYVDVPPALRLERLAQQRGWTAKEVAAREQAQLPLTEKLSLADFVVANAGSPEETARQVRQLIQTLEAHRQRSARQP